MRARLPFSRRSRPKRTSDAVARSATAWPRWPLRIDERNGARPLRPGMSLSSTRANALGMRAPDPLHDPTHTARIRHRGAAGRCRDRTASQPEPEAPQLIFVAIAHVVAHGHRAAGVRDRSLACSTRSPSEGSPRSAGRGTAPPPEIQHHARPACCRWRASFGARHRREHDPAHRHRARPSKASMSCSCAHCRAAARGSVAQVAEGIVGAGNAGRWRASCLACAGRHRLATQGGWITGEYHRCAASASGPHSTIPGKLKACIPGCEETLSQKKGVSLATEK